MSEEQTSYKVTDRRLFNPDGTPREVPAEERPEVKPSTPPTASVEPTPTPTPSEKPMNAEPVSQGTPEPRAKSEPVSEATAEESPELPGIDDPAGFPSFMMSIASNAASALGMMEHPVTGKREVDLELGKHWIDVLGMLQQKTRGNLLPQEEQILEGLLADLRMQYVSLANSSSQKARAYTSRDITGA
jgi:hypothetical protein